MKFLAIASFGLCLISSALAAPVADDSSTSNNEACALLDKRELIATIHNKPTKDPVCKGKELSRDAILEALSHGVKWHAAGIQNGESRYPHEFINAEGFSFPACEGGTIIEYPVLRTVHNPWIPGTKNTKLNSKANPDRVIFTVKSASEGTYCGTITHNYNMKNPKNGKPGAIEPCVEKS